MQAKDIYLSVIIPVYNASAFLQGTLAELDANLIKYDKPLELVFVDDGSSDSSNSILGRFASENHPYTVIHLANRSNRGKGFSVAYGMLSARGKYRVFTDCDLAYPPAEIFKVVSLLEDGFDVVTACRVDGDSRYTISPSFFHYLYTRHVASRVLNWCLRRVLLPLCRDSQSGLKGFAAKAADDIFKRQKICGFGFDMEVLFLADKMGLLLKEMPVNYRYFDEPTTVIFLKDSFNILRDVVRIRWHNFRKGYSLSSGGKKGRRLIVNADDFGLSKPVSEGIIDAFKNGMVRSTSVMTNTAAFENSFQILREAEGLGIGLHLTLTCGMPVCRADDVKSLVTADGLFYPKKKFFMRWFFGRIDLDDVRREFSAQFNRLKEKGAVITHINSHHHVHMLPGIRDVVARLAVENSVGYVRALRGPYLSKDVGAIFRQWFVARFAGSYPQFWRRNGIHSADFFSGFHLTGGGDLLKRWKMFVSVLSDGVTEVMVHPGHLDEDLNDPYQAGRVRELEVLKSTELKDACQNAGVELIVTAKTCP